LSKLVEQYDLEGNLISTYKSVTEAASINNIIRSSISKVCRGVFNYKTAGGYIWKYK
jgi:hypothetical protein